MVHVEVIAATISEAADLGATPTHQMWYNKVWEVASTVHKGAGGPWFSTAVLRAGIR